MFLSVLRAPPFRNCKWIIFYQFITTRFEGDIKPNVGVNSCHPKQKGILHKYMLGIKWDKITIQIKRFFFKGWQINNSQQEKADGQLISQNQNSILKCCFVTYQLFVMFAFLHSFFTKHSRIKMGLWYTPLLAFESSKDLLIIMNGNTFWQIFKYD